MFKLPVSPFIRDTVALSVSVGTGLLGTYLCGIWYFPRDFYANWVLVLALFLICGSLLYTIRIVKSRFENLDEHIARQDKSIDDCIKTVESLSWATANCVQDASYNPTIMQIFSKELILDDEIFRTGKCKFVHTLKILNMHNSTYQNYSYETESSEDLTDIKGYNVNIDNKSYTLQESNLQRAEHYIVPHDAEQYGKKGISNRNNGNKKNGKNKQWDTKSCKITIPVTIEPKKSKTIVIEELDCPSFRKLKDSDERECLEYISSMIYYPTDKLTIKVTLKEGTLDGWILDRGTVTDSDNKYLEYKITDRSEQILESYGHELNRREQRPLYSEDKRSLKWTVSYPKIGCRYRLYFVLVKKPPEKEAVNE